MKGPWVKVWRKMLTDEHLALLTETYGDKAFRIWVTLLLRSDAGTVLDSRQLLSSLVRAKQEKLDKIIASMVEMQMISLNESGQIVIPKWNSYQECKSAPRMRALRERQSEQMEASHERHKGVTVTGRRIEGIEDRRIEEYKSNTKRAAPFVSPTLEEVKAYCEERANGIDPEAWIAHYESNGWKVGKNPMKDWRAAVRTWEHSGFESEDQVKAREKTERHKIVDAVLAKAAEERARERQELH
jgi:hypothetical protein